jgi:HAD superfamily hydrolase (TIGR01490 family)
MQITQLTQLALFDLDNTLLSGDSDFEWAQFLIAKGVVDHATHAAKNREFFEQYQAGTLNIGEFLDFQLKPLAQHPRAELDAWHAEFMRTHILPIIGNKARALVKSHLDKGALCAIVTATNSFVTGPIAREFGIAHLVATVPAQNSAHTGPHAGKFTGQVRGTPAFREGKIARVEAWLETLGLWWGSFGQSYFYSDSYNDLPLLLEVTHPIVVNPDNKLRAHAQTAGWTMLSLRD